MGTFGSDDDDEYGYESSSGEAAWAVRLPRRRTP